MRHGLAAALALLSFSAAALAAAPLHTVSIRTDGRDELRISDGMLTVQHISWALPTNLAVDGTPQALVWSGNTSSALPVPISGDYWITKSAGRDAAYAVQRSNGFSLVAIDNPNGDDLYQFDLYDAPQVNSTNWMHVHGGSNTPGRMSFTGLNGYTPQTPGTETTFSLNVDGTDELVFTDGNLVIRHLSWGYPTSLLVNGQPQTVNFSNNISAALVLSLPEEFQFTQVGGRSIVYPIETPVGLMLSVADEGLGADTYTWKITAIPEPSAAASLGLAVIVLVRRSRRR